MIDRRFFQMRFYGLAALSFAICIFLTCSEDKSTTHIPANTPDPQIGHVVRIVNHSQMIVHLYWGGTGYRLPNNRESGVIGPFDEAVYAWRVEIGVVENLPFRELGSGSINLIHDVTCHVYENSVAWD